MNNEELKKKIVEIINDGIIHGEDNFGVPTSKTIESIADALISSGYVVDMPALIDGSMGIFVPNKGSMELYPTSIKEQLAAAEHRAEVAERALENACVVILSSRNGDQPRRLRAYYKAYLEAAEKELAEERE